MMHSWIGAGSESTGTGTVTVKNDGTVTGHTMGDPR